MHCNAMLQLRCRLALELTVDAKTVCCLHSCSALHIVLRLKHSFKQDSLQGQHRSSQLDTEQNSPTLESLGTTFSEKVQGVHPPAFSCFLRKKILLFIAFLSSSSGGRPESVQEIWTYLFSLFFRQTFPFLRSSLCLCTQ